MKYLLFGTGDYYERYKKWFKPEDILALLDNSSVKHNTYIDGIQVLFPQEGISYVYDAIVILSFYYKEMKQQLIELGVEENKIYHFYDLHNLLYKRVKKKPIIYYGNAEKIVDTEGKLKNKILLLSHDLNLGGPALALYYAAKILSKKGFLVVLASMIDGPLREKLLYDNIPVMVDVNLQIETMQNAEWTNKFSYIFCNTINYYVFLTERNVEIPIIWWLHDSKFFYDGVNKESLRCLDCRNLNILAVGDVPEKMIKAYIPDIVVKRLLYGVADEGFYRKKNNIEEKVCFVSIGYIEARKGQDILVQAVQKLSPSIRRKAKFYFIGQRTSLMAQQIQKVADKIPEIIITGTMNREEINKILDDADVFICSSREDPMPTVAAEAMMHQVPCILSDVVGTAALVQDNVNGMIFRSEDIGELSEKIEWCINHRAQLKNLGIQARGIYDTYFSLGVFERELLKIIEEL